MLIKDIKTETLQIIRYLESNNGKYTKHNSSAFGSYGIKPVTALEYTGMNINYKNEDVVASKLYDKITEELNTKDPNAIVFAWLNGVYGTKRYLGKPIPYKSILNHWHVKKYRNKVTPYKRFLIDTNLLFKTWRIE